MPDRTAARLSISCAIIALALVACSAAAPGTTDAASEDAITPEHLVEIGTRGDGAMFTPWSNEEIIPLVWGAQGGVMVTPAVAIDGALVPAVDPTLVVQLENYDATTGARLADFPGYGPVNAFFARLDARLVNGPIFDQLGWTDDSGRRVRIHAHVLGMGVDAHGEVTIVLGSAGAMPLTPG
jgi:hypothetical protein